jgi:phage terminase large subunit-like protein
LPSVLSAIKPFCALAESGNLAVVKADWNDAFFQELESFSGEKSIQRTMKDDQVDATSAAFACLARQTLLPVFSVPELTQKSPIPTI